MSRLISLELWDFQRHEHVKVRFDPRLTVLVAPNGGGKSTLIRALRWVAFNRPLGDSVMRWGACGAKVCLTTEECKVVREKCDGVNNYRLGSGKPFDAVGTSVPDRVSKLLRLEEVNFQAQIATPLWLTQSAAEVAREMNRVVDLEVIDRAMSFAQSKSKAITAEVKVLTGILEDAEERARSLQWVTHAERLLQLAQDRTEQARAARQRAEGMSRLVEEIQGGKTTLRKLPDTSMIDRKIVELRTIQAKIGGMSGLVEGIKRARSELCGIEKEIAQVEEAIRLSTPRVCPACKQVLPTTSRE